MAAREWIIRHGQAVDLSAGLVMGIINLTPDSFSDGGLYLDPPKALERAGQLLNEGAGILDLGGESTRPGADFTGEKTEQKRLLPVLHALVPLQDKTILSIDTWRSSTARLAMEKGARVINDISGGLFDPDMPELLAQFRPGYILGHAPAPPKTMRKTPRYADVVEDILDFFQRRLTALTKAGLPEERIVLDPGLGFGKTLEHNLDILRRIERFQEFGLPLCVGASRKSFLGELLGLEQGPARDQATQTLVALLNARGVRVHRVHEARGAALALKLQQATDARVSPAPRLQRSNQFT
ncbi:MAG: dihydropteroate synthase [Desulfovibrionaceae bacterium]|nr:dihydropteroate synthase [Desulfovibrionaceae bacterium]